MLPRLFLCLWAGLVIEPLWQAFGLVLLETPKSYTLNPKPFIPERTVLQLRRIHTVEDINPALL